MLTLKELDEAIELNASANAANSLGTCFNADLMAWILTEIKAMLFKTDGTRRSSILVGKGRLIMFALTLAGKVAKCLFDNRKRKEQDIQH
jgi:hypothetical protein